MNKWRRSEEHQMRLKQSFKECSKLLNSFIKAVKSSPNSGLQRKREMTKDEQETESFLADAREQLAKIHPGIYGKKP